MKTPKVLESKYSIYASHRDKLNPSFTIQIFIILYGTFCFIDCGVYLLPLWLRVIGLSLFTLQLIVNYHIWRWSIRHFVHPLGIPLHTNWTAWIMTHFLMPIAVGRWPELLFRRLTARCRRTYPALIFWGAARSGTPTFSHHLRCTNFPNVQFVGPFSPITTLVTYNKESFYFVTAFGANQHFTRYSMAFPMNLRGLCCDNTTSNKIYFDGYPNFHSFPFVRDRLYAINPGFKFVFFVREPCSKVISSWCLMQDTFLQFTGKKASYFTKTRLDKLFRDSLDAIHSEKFQALYRFFVDLEVDAAPKELHQNIADWKIECVLGRALYGRDLRYWFEKFEDVDQWLILDMKTVLRDGQSVKNAVKEICTFVGVEMDGEWMEQWVPTTLRLNQNNIRYTPREEDMRRLKEFYADDQRDLYAFIREKGLRFICDEELATSRETL